MGAAGPPSLVNDSRARILLVTRNLPPLVGGMERLNWHMAEELAKFADVRVVGPKGSAALAPAGVEVREAPLAPLWKFLWRARVLARSEAKTWRPQIVLAGSGLTAPIACSAAGVCGARTAVYVHGLDVAVKHPLYRAGWLPAIRRADRVIANSHATAALCHDIGVDPTRIGIVHPGVELPAGAMSVDASSQARDEVGSPPSKETGSREVRGEAALRQRPGFDGYPLLLSVGRLSARKGLREFVSRALPRIVSAQPRALLLIVGGAPSQALHAQTQSRESIQTAADAAGVGKHIRFLGKVADDELSGLYRAADVHVFPIRSVTGDPEGFGMVAVEAAAHGLSTVAFATGGVVDAVGEGQSGYLVTPGDYTAFADAALKAIAARDSLRSGCVAFSQSFAWPVFGERMTTELLGIQPSTSSAQVPPE